MKLCKEVAVRTKEKDDVNEFDELEEDKYQETDL